MEVAVFEVGLGGRLDATHVLPTKVVILTPIHFDHEALLGNTLPSIAREKAAILPRGGDAVMVPQERPVRRVIQRVARLRNARIWPPLQMNGVKISLLGDFQRLNAEAALRAARILRDRYHFPVTEEGAWKGVASNHWPGRMEIFRGRPTFLLDGAHNPKSIEALARNLKRIFPNRRKILIFGTSRDKRSDRMIPFLAKVSKICILTESLTPRAKEVSTLLKEARSYFPILFPTSSSEEALRLAKELAKPEDLIVVTGSFYLIGEVRPKCRA